jgi:hypothetical protein
MNIKKELKDIFVEKPWWDKTTEEINTEIKQIKWIIRGLFIFGFILVIYMLANGLFIHR